MAADCTAVALAEHGKDAGKSLYNKLAELTACMRPRCRFGRDHEFVACFDPDNLLAALNGCTSVYEKERDAPLLLEMFNKSIAEYKASYCNEILGVMRDGECFITIGIGLTPLAIKQTQEFRVGDRVICSQRNFGVYLEGSQIAKRRSQKNIILAGVRLGAQVLSFASLFVGSQSTDLTEVDRDGVIHIEQRRDKDGSKLLEGIVKRDLTWDITQRTLDMTATAMSVVPEFLFLDEETSTDGRARCYAMKDGRAIIDERARPLFREDEDVFYILRWTPDWTEYLHEFD
jgi:hypothetical protein